MSEQEKQFDASAKFGVTIQSGGAKRCEVRYPTDDEWCKFARQQKTVRRGQGRGFSSDEIGAEEAAGVLLLAIRTDDGTAFDGAEAAAVVAKLERARVVQAEEEGGGLAVTLLVLGGVETVHMLRMPTQAQVRNYERASTTTMTVRRSQEIRAFLDPAGPLYDALVVGSSGYAGAIPIVHKFAALNELLGRVAELETEEDGFPE